MNLNLGCGDVKIDGTVGVDFRDASAVDVKHDLNVFPYPFEDESVEVVYAYDVIEHLDDVIAVVKEIWRILVVGGGLVIETVSWSHDDAYTDLTHKHAFTLCSFDYFDPTTALGSRLGYYSDKKFTIIGKQSTGANLRFVLEKIGA